MSEHTAGRVAKCDLEFDTAHHVIDSSGAPIAKAFRQTIDRDACGVISMTPRNLPWGANARRFAAGWNLLDALGVETANVEIMIGLLDECKQTDRDDIEERVPVTGRATAESTEVTP